MADLCLSRTVTSFCVSSFESLSLMITGVCRLLCRKTYFKPGGRGFNYIEGGGGFSFWSSSMGSANSSSYSIKCSTSKDGWAISSKDTIKASSIRSFLGLGSTIVFVDQARGIVIVEFPTLKSK
jgi:hypothetical protein